eukprot:jgi/Botrbrau1/2953/Bobra.0026s0024.1
MYLASRAVATIGEALALPEKEVRQYREQAERLGNPGHLAALHWDSEAKQYRDWGNHTEDVSLGWMEWQNAQGQVVHRELVRRLTGEPPKPQFVPHFGYVSLFPLVMRMLPPDSSGLAAQLEQLRDERLMWTPFGLRSLSASSSLFMAYNTQHDAPYWRGPIWPNLNYLVLAALKHYSQIKGPHAEQAGQLHDELKAAFLGNVVKVYHQRGYLYENYDEATGAGRGSHPFTGWTALIVLIASETYVQL